MLTTIPSPSLPPSHPPIPPCQRPEVCPPRYPVNVEGEEPSMAGAHRCPPADLQGSEGDCDALLHWVQGDAAVYSVLVEVRVFVLLAVNEWRYVCLCTASGLRLSSLAVPFGHKHYMYIVLSNPLHHPCGSPVCQNNVTNLISHSSWPCMQINFEKFA